MIARWDYDEDPPAPIVRNQCRRISAVAELLDISVSSVRRLIRDGRLAAVYIGTSLRVPEQGLEALLKAGARRSKGRGKK
jgi:excisionase family DNA binding protein